MKIIKNEVKNEKIIELQYTTEEIKNILINHARNIFNINDGIATVNFDRIFYNRMIMKFNVNDDFATVLIIKDLSK